MEIMTWIQQWQDIHWETKPKDTSSRFEGTAPPITKHTSKIKGSRGGERMFSLQRWYTNYQWNGEKTYFNINHKLA